METKNITYKVSKKAHEDGSHDVRFSVDDDEIGFGYKSSDGTICMVRCPNCDTENYSVVVATGTCAWCSFNPNEQAEEEK